MDKIELQKRVAGNELKNYFLSIRKLMESGMDFCVPFTDVWPLAYSRKDAAVRELRNKFTEGEDFMITSVPTPLLSGGKTHVAEIKLTTKCLEHFIASKVPAVFEVYRQVFHEACDREEMLVALPNFQNPAEAARAWAHQYELKEEARRKALKLQKNVNMLKPDAEYAKTILKASTGYTMDDMAKYMGIKSGQELAKILHSKKVLLKAKSPYKLAAKYLSDKHPVYVTYGTEYDGHTYSKATLTWTEEGKRLIASLLN